MIGKRTCGQIVLIVAVALAIFTGSFAYRQWAADRDAARCVRAGANPVVMTDGRVECWK